MDSSEAMAYLIVAVTFTVAAGMILTPIGFGIHYRLRTRYLRTPLPKKSRNVVVKSLKKLEPMADGRLKRSGSYPLADIKKSIERYYKALNGRADREVVFVEIEKFINGAFADFTTMYTLGDYVDKKKYELCISEIEDFADYMSRVAERATAEQISGTYGAIELREEGRSIERQFAELTPSPVRNRWAWNRKKRCPQESS